VGVPSAGAGEEVRLVFCGTPQFAMPTLDALHGAGHEIALVVTQPDRPKGRGMEVQFSPVKQKAIELRFPVTQPEKIKNNAEFRSRLEAIAPEAIIVVAYGRIIPKWMLDLPMHGNINLHASLLPKYRGAAPIQWAIANGETVSGNTTMRIDEGLDTGDILLQQELPIASDDTSLSYAPVLASAGAKLMVETLDGFERGEISARMQDDSQATLAPLLSKEDGRIDFNRTAEQIYDRLRGFQPWPGAWTTYRGKQLSVTAARPVAESIFAEPGVMVAGERLLVGCGGGSVLELLEVQPEGKKRMTASAFIAGYQPGGQRLGS
jgi:methionyl-tRNA formyltransferase